MTCKIPIKDVRTGEIFRLDGEKYGMVTAFQNHEGGLWPILLLRHGGNPKLMCRDMNPNMIVEAINRSESDLAHPPECPICHPQEGLLHEADDTESETKGEVRGEATPGGLTVGTLIESLRMYSPDTIVVTRTDDDVYKQVSSTHEGFYVRRNARVPSLLRKATMKDLSGEGIKQGVALI